MHVALPGESCAGGEFCADGAICAPGLDACVCQVGWQVRNGKCRKGKRLRKRRGRGGRIHPRPETHENALQNVFRPTHITSPSNGSVPLETDENALLRSGFVTETHQQHTLRNAFTTTETTASAAKAVVKSLFIPLGESCVVDADCTHIRNAHCAPRTRRCVCIPGFLQLYGSSCVPEDRVRLPGDECIAVRVRHWFKNGQMSPIERALLRTRLLVQGGGVRVHRAQLTRRRGSLRADA